MLKLSPVLLLLSVFLVGCVSVDKLTKAEAYPLMYEERPHVIAVLPPINNTTSADAKEYYMTTVAEPLNQLGYYVIPVEIMTDVLQSEGLTDTELFRDQSMRQLGETFGADAVLFTEINEWDKNYAVIASSLIISIDAQLKSTKTDQVLWSYRGRIVADLTGQSGNSGNIVADLVASAIVTAINTAAADYVNYAQLATSSLLYSIPLGRYREGYMADGESVVIFPPGVEPASDALDNAE